MLLLYLYADKAFTLMRSPRFHVTAVADYCIEFGSLRVAQDAIKQDFALSDYPSHAI